MFLPLLVSSVQFQYTTISNLKFGRNDQWISFALARRGLVWIHHHVEWRFDGRWGSRLFIGKPYPEHTGRWSGSVGTVFQRIAKVTSGHVYKTRYWSSDRTRSGQGLYNELHSTLTFVFQSVRLDSNYPFYLLFSGVYYSVLFAFLR